MVCEEQIFRNQTDLSTLLSAYRQAKRKNCEHYNVLLNLIASGACLKAGAGGWGWENDLLRLTEVGGQRGGDGTHANLSEN